MIETLLILALAQQPAGTFGVWCEPTLRVQNETTLPRGMVVAALDFWQPFVPYIALHTAKSAPTVPILRVDVETPKFAEVGIGRWERIPRGGRDVWCMSDLEIRIFPAFWTLDAETQLNYLTHEIGHLFGLADRDNAGTIMAREGVAPYALDGEQRAALALLYGEKR